MDATIVKLWMNFNMATNLMTDAMGGTSNIVGEFAERLVAEYYEGEKLTASSKSADIVLKDGTTIQVKGRIPRQTLTTSLGVIRSWDFDYLVAVLFAIDGTVVKAVKMDAETAKSVATPDKHQNGWVITTTKNFLEHPLAHDITDCLNRVMGGNGGTSATHASRTVSQSSNPKINNSRTFASMPDDPVVTEPLYLREHLIETVRRKHESFQDFVKRTLRNMFDNNLIPQEEIKLLQTKDYSKQAFGLEYPLFEAAFTKTKDASGRSRYWSQPLYGKYYVCSQWWKQKMDIYELRFAKWIRCIIALNELKGKDV